MTEPSRVTWKQALLTAAKMLLPPVLLLGAVALSILGLGLAQRMEWISAGGSPKSYDPMKSAATSEAVQYICPMMCTPPLNEPGRCPVCGMELVAASSGNGDSDERSITIDPASRRIVNIQTAPVKSVEVVREIHAVGRLSYDEGRLKTLSAYVAGRLDRLYADYTGVVVNQGDDLALLYCPELYTAQTELLSAKRSAQRSRASTYSGGFDSASLFKSARRKLIDLGMTEKQIARLEETEQPTTRIELVAPIHGTVIEKLANEGDYVKTGQPVYRLADLTTVWLMLELFPEDAAAVRYGQQAVAEVQSLPGRKIVGRVAFIDPMVNPVTRTLGVRVVIPNETGQLKIGDYARASISVPVTNPADPETGVYDPDLAGKWISPRHPHVIEDAPGACRLCGIGLVPASTLGFLDEPVSDGRDLVVPRNAVLMAGDKSVVYVETEPGRFEIRLVELGPSLGEEIVLYGGVEEGEQVATNGNFLIDSQMQLAGNPSLIDPSRAETEPAETESTEPTPEILAALAELSDTDRMLAEGQRICPVTKYALGSMGTPLKVELDGRTIFLCCEGCRQPLLDDPEKYLANLKDSAMEMSEDEEPPTMDLPSIGPIIMIEPIEEESPDSDVDQEVGQ